MWTMSDEGREKIRKAKLGSKNPAWKGDSVGYKGLHQWVNEHKPKVNACEHCGRVLKRLEAANISKQYKRDINDYIWLCHKCHYKFDGLKVSDNFRYSSLGKPKGAYQKQKAREGQLRRWELWRQQHA